MSGETASLYAVARCGCFLSHLTDRAYLTLCHEHSARSMAVWDQPERDLVAVLRDVFGEGES